MPNIAVDGIVAMSDKKPYVRLFIDGKQVAQLSMAEVRKIAGDLVQMASRTEADSIIHSFFSMEELPIGATVACMMKFREFRKVLDGEMVGGFYSNPEPEVPPQ